MAEFKAPQSATDQRKRRAYRDDRQVESERRGSKSSRPTRSRTSSVDSQTDDRYQNDQYLGALRSPLRSGSKRTSRRVEEQEEGKRTLRHCRQSDKHDVDMRQNHSWRHHRNSTTVKQEGSDIDIILKQPWKPESLDEFPPLNTCTNWAEVEQSERSRIKQEVDDSEQEDKQASSRQSSPKRRFTEDELANKGVEILLARRQKQIDYGKNLSCYQKYVEDVPRKKRQRNVHPSTPDKYINYSRRGWDMLVKIWKKKLHYWEPSGTGGSTSTDGSVYEASDTALDDTDEVALSAEDIRRSMSDKDERIGGSNFVELSDEDLRRSLTDKDERVPSNV